jgi:hypothetical protein
MDNIDYTAKSAFRARDRLQGLVLIGIENRFKRFQAFQTEPMRIVVQCFVTSAA